MKFTIRDLFLVTMIVALAESNVRKLLGAGLAVATTVSSACFIASLVF